MNWVTVGIDPAPKKPAGVWRSGAMSSFQPVDLRPFLVGLAESYPNLLIAWDAPLSFDRGDLCDRIADKVARAWVKRHVQAGHFAPGAIGVRTFAGLSHWTVSCLTLGLPFGDRLPGLRLATYENVLEGGLMVVEVHPAVALGLLWLANEVAEPMPRYKKKPEQCQKICAALNFPAEAATDDDTLDAFIAERLARQFLSGDAEWFGSPELGGYVVPKTEEARRLQNAFDGATPNAGPQRMPDGSAEA